MLRRCYLQPLNHAQDQCDHLSPWHPPSTGVRRGHPSHALLPIYKVHSIHPSKIYRFRDIRPRESPRPNAVISSQRATSYISNSTPHITPHNPSPRDPSSSRVHTPTIAYPLSAPQIPHDATRTGTNMLSCLLSSKTADSTLVPRARSVGPMHRVPGKTIQRRTSPRMIFGSARSAPKARCGRCTWPPTVRNRN